MLNIRDKFGGNRNSTFTTSVLNERTNEHNEQRNQQTRPITKRPLKVIMTMLFAILGLFKCSILWPDWMASWDRIGLCRAWSTDYASKTFNYCRKMLDIQAPCWTPLHSTVGLLLTTCRVLLTLTLRNVSVSLMIYLHAVNYRTECLARLRHFRQTAIFSCSCCIGSAMKKTRFTHFERRASVWNPSLSVVHNTLWSSTSSARLDAFFYRKLISCTLQILSRFSIISREPSLFCIQRSFSQASSLVLAFHLSRSIYLSLFCVYRPTEWPKSKK